MTHQFYFWVLSEENEHTNSKRYVHPVFMAALFMIAKIQKQPK